MESKYNKHTPCLACAYMMLLVPAIQKSRNTCIHHRRIQNTPKLEVMTEVALNNINFVGIVSNHKLTMGDTYVYHMKL